MVIKLNPESWITSVTIHPGGDMNVGTKFRGSSSNSSLTTLLKITSVNPLMVLEEK